MKNNYTKRKGAKVTILTCVKQKRKENKEQNNNNNKKQPNMAKTLMKQREKGWGIQYFDWPIPVFYESSSIRFIRKNHEYTEYRMYYFKIIKGSYILVWRGTDVVRLLRKINRKKKKKITQWLFFVTFVHSQRLDGFGFMNEVRLTLAFITESKKQPCWLPRRLLRHGSRGGFRSAHRAPSPSPSCFFTFGFNTVIVRYLL